MNDTIMTMTDVELRAVLLGLAHSAPEATANQITQTLAITREGA